MTRKAPDLPRYHNTYPEGLATAADLEALGLKPGSIRPVALLTYEDGDRSGMCGLFEREAAVLKDSPSPNQEAS
ncbi:hypothetical protein DAETH_48450 (plasmid) [Deinococcus aetherius]|uniref:Uncharacterized protein n=1 Tax=Deinococcus aetherius TaxID=200252 RepID=A0ABN6RSC9_9DEIO|nr:hypothetical protein [Deinococcus aetherius]BDP44876.1 hypothetical protein DAETH_48450 [Deinococcus aetherius]